MVESEWRKPGERANNPERGSFVALRRERTAGLLAGLGLKGKVSTACYAAGIGMAFVAPIISLALYVGVAFFWLLPDRRIERALKREPRVWSSAIALPGCEAASRSP